MNKDESVEYWFARNLQELLEYNKWENFVKVINKAKEACKNSKHKISDHFPENHCRFCSCTVDR